MHDWADEGRLCASGDSPNIVQDQTFAIVEAGSDVPLLPFDEVALHLRSHHTRSLLHTDAPSDR